jgi:Na+-transporting NADH:ubiquinone oxidoreductase subunit A
VVGLLQESGLLTAIRQRPFSTVAQPSALPHAVFVTAIDTNPLAPSVDVVLAGKEADFKAGVAALAKLAPGRTFVCKAPGSSVPDGVSGASVEEFRGQHPAGLAGTHIHLLAPASAERRAWYVGYQDVVAIGRLFLTGKLDPERVVSVAGPQVNRPRLFATRLGAELAPLVQGNVADGENRVVSGSPLHGRTATSGPTAFLGRYHQQITVLREGRERQFLGWLGLGTDKFSTVRTFLSGYLPAKKFALSTNTNGSHRAMVPIGMFERVMPLDIMPTFLLRALVMDDLERATALGMLELDEEDLALCSFVSPGKEDWGVHLRRNLFAVWKEG